MSILFLASVSAAQGVSGDEHASAVLLVQSGAVVYPMGKDSHQRRDDKYLKQSLHSIGADQFALDEFCGSYSIPSDPDRKLTVSRVPGDVDALLFNDSTTGMTRVLYQFSSTIFTYGPDSEPSGPVEGSVMFLAIKESALSKKIGSQSRLLWQPAIPPAIVATRATSSN
ncbi:hypothetical protein [Desulfovibrio ferrophilus]|uniref:hypothetical protein n=1 Tax=Desulfovibrio ferrophilus TaxID=241368 RepID=UPI000F83488D|nr:hypothetical protein [Desulfovibrio ferrophilus]